MHPLRRTLIVAATSALAAASLGLITPAAAQSSAPLRIGSTLALTGPAIGHRHDAQAGG